MWKKSSRDFHKIPQDKISCKSITWDPWWYVRRDEYMEERTDGRTDGRTYGSFGRKERFCDDLMSSTTIKPTQVFM